MRKRREREKTATLRPDIFICFEFSLDAGLAHHTGISLDGGALATCAAPHQGPPDSLFCSRLLLYLGEAPSVLAFLFPWRQGFIYPKKALNSRRPFPTLPPEHWNWRHVLPHPALCWARTLCTLDKHSINCAIPQPLTPLSASKMLLSGTNCKSLLDWGHSLSLGLTAPAHRVWFHTQNNPFSFLLFAHRLPLQREGQLSSGRPQPWGPCILKTIFLLLWPSKHSLCQKGTHRHTGLQAFVLYVSKPAHLGLGWNTTSALMTSTTPLCSPLHYHSLGLMADCESGVVARACKPNTREAEAGF